MANVLHNLARRMFEDVSLRAAFDRSFRACVEGNRTEMSLSEEEATRRMVWLFSMTQEGRAALASEAQGGDDVER